MATLDKNIINFGKYAGKHINDVLKDRGYCKWFVQQENFKVSNEYLYNIMKSYNPSTFFIDSDNIRDINNFLETYPYFNLLHPSKVKVELSDIEKKCYEYYYKIVSEIYKLILNRVIDMEDNIYAIKAPTNWLNKIEEDSNNTINRDMFKVFLNSYELPNITTIIERIKQEGGIVYKGAQAYNIAKTNSRTQEQYWENILRMKYGDEISVQYKFGDCIFDFVNISRDIIYECKLGLKDFNKKQYDKYTFVLSSKYKIVYLIGNDCVIDIKDKKLYTSSLLNYSSYKTTISNMKNPSFMDLLLLDFEFIQVENSELLGNYV